jgi:hypothetical protein
VNVLRAFFLIPVFVARTGVLEGSPLITTKLEHFNAHLMIEFKQSEQIRAHNRTESTITTFASKLPSPRYDESLVESWMFVEIGGLAKLE